MIGSQTGLHQYPATGACGLPTRGRLKEMLWPHELVILAHLPGGWAGNPTPLSVLNLKVCASN